VDTSASLELPDETLRLLLTTRLVSMRPYLLALMCAVTAAATVAPFARTRDLMGGMDTRGERFCCKHGVQHSKATNWTLTYIVSPCDTVPSPVEVWAEYRFELEVAKCRNAFTDCCLQFDHRSWSERQERRSSRKEKRQRRRNRRLQKAAKAGEAAASL